MFHDQWNVDLIESQTTAEVLVRIYRKGNERKYEVLYFDNAGNTIVKKFAPGDSIPPTLKLPFVEGREIVGAFAEAAKRLGHEKKSESHVAGLYEAQSHHLEDLRHLLKLDERTARNPLIEEE